MYSTLFCLALLTATAASFTIDDPQLTQCQDTTISWSEGTPPYYLVVVDPKDPCGEPIFDFGELHSTVTKWDVDMPENKEVKLYVEDSGPNEAWSKILTVGASDDASCLSQSVLSYFNMTTSNTASKTASNTASNTSDTSHDTPPSSPSGDIVPVGAANAGNNPSYSGASSTRPGTSTVLVALFAATISLAL